MNEVDNFYSTVERKAQNTEERLETTQIASLRLWNNFIKAVSIATFVNLNLPIIVIDFACGKGGDFFKLLQLFKSIQKYAGIDITRKSLDDFEERIKSQKIPLPPNFQYQLKHLDLRFPIPINDFDNQFTLINIGFAFHYFFETLEFINNFFQNMSRVLLPGGRVIITTPCDITLRQRFEKSIYKSDGRVELRVISEITNDLLCRVVHLYNKPHAYFFELYDAPRCPAVKAEEYFVHHELLQQLCKQYGFDIIYKESFLNFLKKHKNHSLAENMGVNGLNITMSDASILDLYQVIILEKQQNIGNTIVNQNDSFDAFGDVDDFFTNVNTTTNIEPESPPYSSTVNDDYDF